MTDGMASAMAAQLIGALTPVAGEQAANQTPLTQRAGGFHPEQYEAPLPESHDAALKPLLNEAGKFSSQIQEAMSKPLDTLGPEAPADLRQIQDTFNQLRNFQLVELQFSLIGKSLEFMQKNVQTLYQQQS
jgi:hypothetical protein